MVYVVSSTFLANVSPDAMLHRTFILLIHSKGGNGTHTRVLTRVYSCVFIYMSKQPEILRQVLSIAG